jgi:hypothetical protein
VNNKHPITISSIITKTKKLMKHSTLIAICFLAISSVSQAQKGNNQVSIGPELDVPVGSFATAYKIGVGGSVKGLYGIGKAGQITFTTGYSVFKGKSGSSGGYSFEGQTFSVIPLLLGYRYNYQSFYAEVQYGVAVYKTKVTGFDFSETKLTRGIGIGYVAKALDLGLRYQNHKGASLFGIRAAYNINFKK